MNTLLSMDTYISHCVYCIVLFTGMKEDDICELLKFERKMLRARIDTLKNDKFIQTKMKMETGPDGKAQRQNYYYINYKVINFLVSSNTCHSKE